MDFDYEGLKIEVAEPLIEKFGKTVTLTQPGVATGPVYNPTPGVPTAYSVKAVELTIKQSHIDGTLIQQGDRMFLVSTKNAPEPAMNNTMTVDGQLLQVIVIKPLKPGPVTMLWKIK
jgi:hypothetical protein